MPHPLNDVVIVVPGIMGSTLHRDGTPVWEPSRQAFTEGLRSTFRSIKQLALPEGIGDDHPHDGVVPHALMPDIRLPLGLWTFDLGYTALTDFLSRRFEINSNREVGPRNLVTFPYDWRLSNRYNGEQLRTTAESALAEWRDQGGQCANAELIFICHSMGGLVARWYIDHLGGAAHTKAIVTLGTPHRGALNALDQLVNGIRKGPPPFKLDLTQFGRSLPSVHQLLPEYACLQLGSTTLKTTETTLPNLSTAMVEDAMKFHRQIDKARTSTRDQYELHLIGGYEQVTLTTATIDGQHVRCHHTIEGLDEAGDGTVPRLSISPPDINPSSATLHYIADNHAGLVHNQAAFDHIEGILTANPVVHRDAALRISSHLPEVLDFGERLEVRAHVTNGDAPLEVVVCDQDRRLVGYPQRLLPGPDGLQAIPELPDPGVYRVTIRGAGPAGAGVSPITSIVLAWPSSHQLQSAD